MKMEKINAFSFLNNEGLGKKLQEKLEGCLVENAPVTL